MWFDIKQEFFTNVTHLSAVIFPLPDIIKDIKNKQLTNKRCHSIIWKVYPDTIVTDNKRVQLSVIIHTEKFSQFKKPM